MLHLEPEIVASKWRSLTKRCIPSLFDAGPALDRVLQSILRLLAIIVVAAGFEKDIPAAITGVQRLLGDRIQEILRLAVRLDKVIWQDVISHTLAVVNTSAGAQYDRSQMEDGWTGEESSLGGPPRVLCTTALGLESRTSSESRGHMLVKSTVALTTLFSPPDDKRSTEQK